MENRKERLEINLWFFDSSKFPFLFKIAPYMLYSHFVEYIKSSS